MRYSSYKPTLDRLGAMMALVFLSPLLLGIAGVILIVDGRPVLFTQQRAGRNGEPFRIYKFRTLRVGPKDLQHPKRYLTRTGAFLRHWALDELPQLWNVVRGDMSLVGPRPTLCEQAEAYGSFEGKRLRVKPGLTGWAQINGRNALSWPERIELDVWYVEHRSFWLDVRILMRTPFALLHGNGVYGPGGRNDTFPFSSSPESLSQ